jgi:hypothetical protein
MLPTHYTKFVDVAEISKINKEKRNKFFKSYDRHIQQEYDKSTEAALLEESASYCDEKFGESIRIKMTCPLRVSFFILSFSLQCLASLSTTSFYRLRESSAHINIVLTCCCNSTLGSFNFLAYLV